MVEIDENMKIVNAMSPKAEAKRLKAKAKRKAKY